MHVTRSPSLRGLAAGLALAASSTALGAGADWFPDPPTVTSYHWTPAACDDCTTFAPPQRWRRMIELAGLARVRFAVSTTAGAQAAALAPDTIVLAPSLLDLTPCQQAFVVGHELAHLARRHYDEDAAAVLAYSGLATSWTGDGDAAMALLDGDFGLAMRLAPMWQAQEREADWLGSLLAAQACGCRLETGALAYLHGSDGGGLLASHEDDRSRVAALRPFASSARILAARALVAGN